MRHLLLLFAIVVINCVENVSVKTNGNIVCRYDDTIVFSGQVTLEGDGLDTFRSKLEGNWRLCSSQNVICSIDLGSP